MMPPPGARFVMPLVPVALAPDGRTVAIIAKIGNAPAKLWTRPRDSSDAHQLLGTEGAEYPFWSPDGQHVGFFADDKLKKISVKGGGPVDVCPAGAGPNGGGATWNHDDVIIFKSAAGHLQKVPAGGGTQHPSQDCRRGTKAIGGQRFSLTASIFFSSHSGRTRDRCASGR